MSDIHTLPHHIVTKIAAGQVVERPASVVKELVENSIDASAATITVEVEDAGLRSIRVIDNGKGISKEDLSIAPMPHTTSKISTEQDLHSINTLGFRGEALSSIASMSQLNIKSRKGKYGHKVEVINGKINNVVPIGMQKGTIVEVFNLFSSVPARKKDLKSQQVENRQISESLLKTALAHPDLSMELVSNGKHVIKVNAQSQRERVESLMGEYLSEGFIPIKAKYGEVSVAGFIGTPQIAIKNRSRQYIYVNKRPVHSEIISSYVKSLYGTLLDPRLNPSFILFLQLPPDFVDINIHPRKEEVNFFTLDRVLDVIKKAVLPKLKHKNLTYQFSLQKSMSKKTAFVIKDAVSKWSVKPDSLSDNDVLQIDNTFLVTQTNNNLLIVDQHAAHERILYEQFLDVFNDENKKNNSEKLKKSRKITFPTSEMSLFRENLHVFTKLGFEIDDHDSELIITKIPEIYKEHNLHQLFSEVLSDISEDISIDSLTQRTISYLACRSAIKAGDELSTQESKRLVEKLFLTKTNYTCPHGRPVLIEIPLSQLHIAFRRK